MQSFRDLKVWTKAHALVLDVYRGTRDFRSDERFGLVAQMRRAASSVPANIAEGCARSSDADFIRFLHNAAGSANELEYFLSLAHDLNFIRDEDYALLGERVEEVKRMLGGLITRIKADG